MFLLSQTLLKDKKKYFLLFYLFCSSNAVGPGTRLFKNFKYASGAIFELQGDDSKDATAVLIMYYSYYY
jgi:hypothetical protein